MIRKHFYVKLVIFYGSYVKGKPHKDSDIDVAIFIHKSSNQNYYKTVVNLFKLKDKIDDRIEPNLIFYEEAGYEPASFENYIIKNGIILYKDSKILL